MRIRVIADNKEIETEPGLIKSFVHEGTTYFVWVFTEKNYTLDVACQELAKLKKVK